MNEQDVTDAENEAPDDFDSPDAQDSYEAHVRTIATVYEPHVRRLLDEIAAVLTESGFECSDLYDMTDSEFSWAFTAKPVGTSEEQSFDVQVTINESAEHSGTYDGINFSLDVGYWGGLIVGGCTPYNYTEQVWVAASDPEAVDARWREFECAVDTYAVANSINDYVPPGMEKL